MGKIGDSELIINSDGSVFHLHLRPEELADTVILVGDPGRVEMISSFFESKEFRRQSREFVTVTGQYRGRRLSVLSTGIGTDNIDIVVNELDALANIDFTTREIKKEKKSLRILRIGTSGDGGGFREMDGLGQPAARSVFRKSERRTCRIIPGRYAQGRYCIGFRFLRSPGKDLAAAVGHGGNG